MGYSRAVRSSVLKKVLPPDARSIVEVSRETGINDQTIRNWTRRVNRVSCQTAARRAVRDS